MPSTDLRISIESLVRQATSEGTLLVGFAGSLNKDSAHPVITFSNGKERGEELAQLFRTVADLLALCAQNDRVVECPVEEPN